QISDLQLFAEVAAARNDKPDPAASVRELAKFEIRNVLGLKLFPIFSEQLARQAPVVRRRQKKPAAGFENLPTMLEHRDGVHKMFDDIDHSDGVKKILFVQQVQKIVHRHAAAP